MYGYENCKAALFDLDGTLTDPAEGITKSVAYALERFGITVEDRRVLYPFIGPPLLDSFQEFYGMTVADSRRAMEYYREYFQDKGIFENEIYPGIPELLYGLKAQGTLVMVATSKPEEFSQRILEHFGVARYIDFLGGNTLNEDRPAKIDVLRHIFRSNPSIAPLDAVMVGDRRFDAEGARECGMDCIGVTYGYGGREELEQAGANLIVDTVEELSNALLKK